MADDTDPSMLATAAHAPICVNVPCPRVFLLSGNRILREALVAALSRRDTLEVLGASDQPGHCGRIVPSPNVLLLDMCSHDPQAIFSLRESYPKGKIIAFGVAEIDQTILAYARAGVSGFAGLNASLADLVAVVEAAVRGELMCSPKIAGLLLNQVHMLAARERAAAKADALTAREREIVALMGQGLSNKQIARSLSVRNATVKNHVHSIFGKLGVHRRGEVIARLHHHSPADAPDMAEV